ncbi:MAG: glutamate--tRNA ligase [Alphaproteobacteria bacterium]
MRPGLSPDLIKRLLPDAKWTVAELEGKFPVRDLPDSAMVTRFAPSPTGYMHIGGLYQMLIDYKLAKQSGGVFILRIEDTDTKREVEGAVDLILQTAEKFKLNPDEGISIIKTGDYGPYQQSMRKDIYHSVAAHLLATGSAYPCFLTAAEMEEIRENQKLSGLPTGIYGGFARDRDLSEDEIIARVDAGEMPSIRLYSNADKNEKIFCKDAVRGSIAFPQNDEDIVLIKSNDGLPTYHFAHLVDDHFMHTTHVVRGEEWLPSFPLHVQMFNMMNWKAPAYVHTSTLDTIDDETGKQRKLSKRKDLQANVAQFIESGWPVDAVLEYLFNIIASGYEEDKLKGKVKNIWEYELKLKKIPMSGALFDMKKLEWWAKEFIATLSVDDLTDKVMTWAKKYSKEWAERLNEKNDYLHSILGIERDNPKRIRKDFITWKQTLEEVSYFFDDVFVKIEIPDTNKQALSEFLKTFDINDDKDTWWKKIQDVATSVGINNGDAAMALRVALTGRTNTPDLYSIMQAMGDKRVRERIENA